MDAWPPYPDWDLDALAERLGEDPAEPLSLLWRARQLFFFLLRDTGEAAALAGEAPMTLKRRRDILDWLQPVERLAVYLVHLLALMFPIIEPAAPHRRRSASQGARPTDGESLPRLSLLLPAPDNSDTFDPDAPDAEARIAAWHARRDARRARRHAPPAATGPAQPSAGFWSALPLARRLAAPQRLLDDPVPAARRLAVRLARNRLQGGRAPDYEARPRHRHLWPCSSAIDRAWFACRTLARLSEWRPAPNTS